MSEKFSILRKHLKMDFKNVSLLFRTFIDRNSTKIKINQNNKNSILKYKLFLNENFEDLSFNCLLDPNFFMIYLRFMHKFHLKTLSTSLQVALLS